MSFRFFKSVVFITVLLSVCILNFVECHEKDNKHFNRTLFAFSYVKDCGHTDHYDLNYFTCVPCKTLGENLQASLDKFTCACKMSTLSPTVATIYDTAKSLRACTNICNQTETNSTQNNVTILTPQYCQIEESSLPKLNCKFKYINHTKSPPGSELPKSIEMTNLNWQHDGLCDKCDLQYNFHYQDYCIANGLLRPYLGFNSFWQATTQHFGELKFVAFFCLALSNNTACNHLANLCVLSFYSIDKNSPCSKFLLAQASDVAYRYASIDEQLSHQHIRPFLFYRKGKHTAKELREPIKGLQFSLDENAKNTHLNIFSVSYSLGGTLQRWGNLNLNDLNLCPFAKKFPAGDNEGLVRFAKKYNVIECSFKLEHILDMAKMWGNQRFMSLFLNYSKIGEDKILLLSMPVLIEDITLENKRPQKEDWQLVTRFQMIEIRPRHGLIASKASPSYEDAHKLLLYRSLRYVERFELHYDIHDHNQISVPVLKLHYRHIEFTNNTTLGMPLKYQFIISNDRVSQDFDGEMLNKIALPAVLLVALAAALFKANNVRRRRATRDNENIGDDFCHFVFFTEFLLHLISYMALAFLVCFLLHIIIHSLTYLTQSTVQLSLPIVKDYRPLESIIYGAFTLKFIFICIYFWRITHFNIFLIDWERPRCGDTNHFNLKNNLETSSVCSSVRTYISDSNVSAWRSILLANEWIRLSGKQKTSIVLQGLMTYILVELSNIASTTTREDQTLKLFAICLAYICTYICQYLVRSFILTCLYGHPLQKYIDHCSLANISVFTLVEPSYGYYIHGRSPHGFADSDMTTMIMQLQRESQSMCGRRGLLSDTDQCYTIMPPKNLSNYFDKLLLPYQRTYGGLVAGTGGGGHGNYQKEIGTVEGSLEKTSIAYTSVNRFFCAFIDHGIKDMDYIIKEKTFLERILNCEFDNYLTDSKGVFYIDSGWPFGQMFLYGNEVNLFVLHFLLFLTVYLICHSLMAAVLIICIFNKVIRNS